MSSIWNILKMSDICRQGGTMSILSWIVAGGIFGFIVLCTLRAYMEAFCFAILVALAVYGITNATSGMNKLKQNGIQIENIRGSSLIAPKATQVAGQPLKFKNQYFSGEEYFLVCVFVCSIVKTHPWILSLFKRRLRWIKY